MLFSRIGSSSRACARAISASVSSTSASWMALSILSRANSTRTSPFFTGVPSSMARSTTSGIVQPFGRIETSAARFASKIPLTVTSIRSGPFSTLTVAGLLRSRPRWTRTWTPWSGPEPRSGRGRPTSSTRTRTPSGRSSWAAPPSGINGDENRLAPHGSKLPRVSAVRKRGVTKVRRSPGRVRRSRGGRPGRPSGWRGVRAEFRARGG